MQAKVEEIWKDSMKQYMDTKDEADLARHWQHASDLEEMQYQNFKEKFVFSENNPYQALSNPLENIKQVIESGDTRELANLLEAHLQKNPTDSKGWRVLGEVFQERDQDQRSVTCFLNSIKHDPTDRDSLLQLGVTCLNIFDEIHSMSHIGKAYTTTG
jgi:uncharacterized protein HemY